MMTAIVGVFILIDRQFAGMLEEMLLFLVPMPMVFYSFKYGLKDSWLVYAAICLLAFILGTPQMLFYIGSESFLGLVYGSGIHSGVKSEKLVLTAMVIGVIVNLLSTVVFAAFFGYDVPAEIAEMEKVMTQAFDRAGAQIPPTINMPQFILTVFIISAVVMGVLQGYVTHVLSRVMMKRMHFNVEKAKPLALYFPPKWSGYAGLAGFMAYYYSLFRPFADSRVQIAVQGFGICGFMYLLCFGYIGLITMINLRNSSMKMILKILTFFLLFTAPQVLVISGFLYITTDMHQRLLEGALYNAGKNE